MNKEEVICQVENYINGKCSPEDICKQSLNKGDSKDTFLENTVKRLVHAFSLYSSNPAYKNDYLLALRDYLICFDTTISLDDGSSIEDNTFGIAFDDSEKKVFCYICIS